MQEQMQDEKPKHGARVYRMQNKLLVKQTVLRGTPPEYVIDEQRERYVSENDDSAIACAIRDAIAGKLEGKENLTLDNLLATITENNLHSEVETGNPRGREKW
jgi:hypothetical protein